MLAEYIHWFFVSIYLSTCAAAKNSFAQSLIELLKYKKKMYYIIIYPKMGSKPEVKFTRQIKMKTVLKTFIIIYQP